ncbi:3-hydroxyacyl-ACP dehydratase FabZ family protein [Bacillus changyiensis]|uniref:3-hydroxyacyl-ACP dehydratase FabZ family protein n=1 Tax=Bacillus changyiensis TaxID=3004103 RepID=UPI0022E102C3|nr:beta-hydroxyacyl-ACP dehydratase [Bacillus changyiensis]MDA1477741.1 beta-hydroxyacyl-ACP dehydratase [Bacillus changyiensis]
MTYHIEAVLPHRHPFLFITEVKKTVDSIKVEGAYQINHDNMYVININGEKQFPSVLVVESLAQLSAFAEESHDNADSQELVFLTGLQDMQFLKPIYAGDLVELKVEIIRRRRGLTLIEGTASVNGDIVVKGHIKTKSS